ncbi:hypothetical protein [Paragemmobacter straminiformis]|uniref:Uncharacterized protein n=1 Tax=Paragemmobacter straminiformis TaxID=2045119 RepID=A0A842IAE1_9RHOB|nr:hypothetical protein [Gemmobacter straminiformis]MBC2836317.1 hypothetical protein [Gemmobacter straminiformis]
MKKLTVTALAACAALSANAAFAFPCAVQIPTEQTETTGFLGLTLPLVANPAPRISLGVRRATVATSGDMTGGTVEFSFDPWNHGGIQLRATALRGDINSAGILGGGWDFASGRPFATFGARVPNLSVTSDIGAGLTPGFALGLDSLGKQTAPDPIWVAPLFVPTGFSETAC